MHFQRNGHLLQDSSLEIWYIRKEVQIFSAYMLDTLFKLRHVTKMSDPPHWCLPNCSIPSGEELIADSGQC